MEPFDSIEEWISEHGSATVLREHVALLKSQMGDSEAKAATAQAALEACKADMQKLQTKFEESQSQLEDARAEIKRLNSGDASGFLGFDQPTDRPAG